MKKTILILVVLALLVPAAAFAATEFSLGGYIKLDSFWDSTQDSKNMITPIRRNNAQNFHHGRFQMTAQSSRFNFTVKGPNLWGATTTGFIEMDFDQQGDAQQSASHSFVPRLRHAMFRLNWPETELLMGQYWAFNNEFFPETVQDGSFQFHGQSTFRLAQIRLTQQFAGAWTISGMIGSPTDFLNTAGSSNTSAAAGQNYFLGVNGQSSESPHLEGKIAYEQDLYGKAAFYGKPRGFVAQIMAGWQRNAVRNNDGGAIAGFTFGDNQFRTVTIRQDKLQYLNPWVIQGNLFIPIIPTHSANLAGTASASVQWYVGQGLEAFGENTSADNAFFRFRGNNNGNINRNLYDIELEQRYGGYVQGQYYFTNQWFLNVAWGMSKAFGVPQGFSYATVTDQNKFFMEIDATLWYRPIQALKFGLQYAYSRTDWMQKQGSANALTTQAVNNSGVGKISDVGDSHRIEFVGFLYF